MFQSAKEFVAAASRGDVDSNLRVRTDSAPLEVWMDILGEHPEMKRTVTLNKTLPQGILAALARDPDPLVRTDIANTRRLTREVFEMLARDEDEGVRLRLAWNPKLPRDLLEKLSQDPCAVVAGKARERLG